MANTSRTLGDREPNDAHAALVELERRGLLDAVITERREPVTSVTRARQSFVPRD
jgi:hypothetical protein